MKKIILLLSLLLLLSGFNTMSPEGHEFTKSFEGLHRVRPDGKIQSYPDPTGTWTIGWGSTENIRKGMIITKAHAHGLFVRDISKSERTVNRVIIVSLNQNQFNALCDHAYNVGSITGGLLKAVNTGNHELAAIKLSLYKYSKGKVLPGLVRRSSARSALYRSPVDNVVGN